MTDELKGLKEQYDSSSKEKHFILKWDDVVKRYNDKGYSLAQRMIVRATTKAFRKQDEDLGIN